MPPNAPLFLEVERKNKGIRARLLVLLATKGNLTNKGCDAGLLSLFFIHEWTRISTNYLFVDKMRIYFAYDC
jgi:hypothetical protein